MVINRGEREMEIGREDKWGINSGGRRLDFGW